MRDIFEEREKESNQVTLAEQMETRRLLQALVNSEAGRWLLGDLVKTFESKLKLQHMGHNSDAAYHRGIMDATMKYRNLLIQHFGNSIIDKVLKETK